MIFFSTWLTQILYLHLSGYFESPRHACHLTQTYDIDSKFCMIIVHVVMKNFTHSWKKDLKYDQKLILTSW